MRKNLDQFKTQKKIRKTAPAIFKPPFFFVEKEIIGTFEDCEKALEDVEINESIDIVHSLVQKGIIVNIEQIDYIDSITLGVYKQIFPTMH